MPPAADLAGRIREILGDEPGVEERRMFGGVAFLLGGNMAVAAREDELLVRVGAERTGELLATTDAQPMEMRGRPVRGWLRVDGAAAPAELARWVDLGAAAARSLPAKR